MTVTSVCESPNARGRSTLSILLFCVLAVMQYLLFRTMIEREIAWVYPFSHDQVKYLISAHQLYEHALTHGFVEALQRGLATITPNGLLLPIHGMIAFLLGGPTRLSALTVNFVYWIALQGAVFWTLRWLTGRWTVAWFGLGLLLLARAPMQTEGSILDFRIDFVTLCLFGILICAVIRSNLFLDRKWAIVVGAMATVICLFRYLTAVYLLLIFGLTFVGLLGVWIVSRLKRRGAMETGGRLVNMAIAAAIVVVVCVPVLLRSYEELRDYYVVGHVTGPEKGIRARLEGITSSSEALWYYYRSFRSDHAGVTMWRAMRNILLAAGVIWLGRALLGKPWGDISGRLAARGLIAFAGLCVLVPYVVLTSDEAKSPVVANIMIGPAWWLVMLVLIACTGLISLPRLTGDPAPRWICWHSQFSRIVLVLVACISMWMGITRQASLFGHRGRYSLVKDDIGKILSLHDEIGLRSAKLDMKEPRIFVDRIADYMAARIVKVSQLERNQIYFEPQDSPALHIFEMPADEILAGLRAADFAVVTLHEQQQTVPYPYNESCRRIQADIIRLADEIMLPLREIEALGFTLRLYMRPTVALSGDSAGWLTADGATMTVDIEALKKFGTITLTGESSLFPFKGDNPTPRAKLLRTNGESVDLPAEMVTDGERYVINIRLNHETLPPEGSVQIRLDFDKYFIPMEIGTGPDPRKLVIMTPREVRLTR